MLGLTRVALFWFAYIGAGDLFCWGLVCVFGWLWIVVWCLNVGLFWLV